MKDTDLMPWGLHVGKMMANVPPEYLLWLFENNKCSGNVKKYIIDNMDSIKLEIKQK